MDELEFLINEEAELSILGSLLQEKELQNRIETINSKIFSNTLYRDLFKVIQKIIIEGKEVDIPLVYEYVNKNISITSLTNIVLRSNIYTFEQNIKLLNDLFIKRNLYEKISILKNKIIRSDNIDELIYKIQEIINEVDINEEHKDDIGSISSRLLEYLESPIEDSFKFGIKVLDESIGGVFKGELTTIGAKSGVGKTALALNIALNAILQDKKVLIISREMKDINIMQRLITQLTGVSTISMKTRQLSEDNWSDIVGTISYLSSKNLYINHNISTPDEIVRRVREIKPDLLVVDYLQLLSSELNSSIREQEVAHLSRKMKQITLNFNTSVIQLTQLNEKFTGRPMGEGVVRESRAIYHDSNNVIYIHKPLNFEELLKLSEGDEKLAQVWLDFNYNTSTNIYEIIVAKNRDGICLSEKMWYIGERLTFKEFNKKKFNG